MRTIALILIFALNTFAIQIVDNTLLENFIRSELSEQHLIGDTKCGTGYDLLIHFYQDQLDPDLFQLYSEKVRVDLVRERSLTTPSGYFTLHWNESGDNAVPSEDLSGNGYPDYIDSAAVIFNSVREIEVEHMGYQAPPAQDGQPAIPYHIYFSALSGVYGRTVPSYIDIPSLPGENWSSYIEVDNDYYGFPTPGLDGLKVTAAHEFHHAIQMGYNMRGEDAFFTEMTSTWMEEALYPEINDYLFYLDDLFANVSNTRFNTFSGVYPYGNSLYLHMLAEHFGTAAVKSIWDHIKNDVSIWDAIATTLEQYNSSWVESLGEYGLWLFYTGDRTLPDQFFTDASKFPKVQINAVDIIDFEESYNNYVGIERVANRYFEFNNTYGKFLNISVNSGGIPQAGFRSLTNNFYSIFRPFNQQVTNEPVDSDPLVLILTNAEYETLNSLVNITISSNIDVSSVYPFPSPANLTKTDIVRFQNIPADADLYILNTSGRRVAVIEGEGNSLVRTWYLKNEAGKQIAAGIYLYVVKGDGILKTGKLSVLH